MIWVEKVLEIGCQGSGKTLGIKNLDAVTIKESNHSEAGCVITLYYFRNTYPSGILSLVRYREENNIEHC